MSQRVFHAAFDSLLLHPRRPRPLSRLSHALGKEPLDLIQRVHGLADETVRVSLLVHTRPQSLDLLLQRGGFF